MATGALHRGVADSFVVKKWKGKGRGSDSKGDKRRRGRRGDLVDRQGAQLVGAGGGLHGMAAHAGRE
jgi:hypothetical protein